MIFFTPAIAEANNDSQGRFWEIQSIDTMKQSRDLARQKLSDPTYDAAIASTVRDIADTGATHIAIDTPYDDEFNPFLERWLNEARKDNLKIWFRGNWSGWEGWFNYPKITPEEHIKKTTDFIKNHSKYFEDGDIFSPCPECENGVIGDPRSNNNEENYRQFIIKEFQDVMKEFRFLNKKVNVYYSMNGDVAKLIMDDKTAASLGGTAVIDHYVSTPEDLNRGISELSGKCKCNVILGEWGVPIPDLQGNQSEDDQEKWISGALDLLSRNEKLIGLNYWVGYGGTTAIWKNDGTAKKSVADISSYFKPRVITGKVINVLNVAIKDASVATQRHHEQVNENGSFSIPIMSSDNDLIISASGYKAMEYKIDTNTHDLDIILIKEKEGLIFKFERFLRLVFGDRVKFILNLLPA